MMKNFHLGKYLLFFILTISFYAEAGSDEEVVRLQGHVPKQAMAKAFFLKNLETEKDISLTFTLPLRNQEALEELLQRIYDPADQEHYGKYLDSKEFIKRFAPTKEDHDKIVAYAKKSGLTVIGTHSNRTLINVSGKVGSIEKCFNLTLRKYLTKSGREFYAPSQNPEVPVSIASIITGVVGLNNLAVWKPYHERKHSELAHPSGTESHSYPSGPGRGFAPNDLIRAYNLTGISETGSGQIIALFELASYQASDISAYTNQFGLPPANLKNILVNGGSGTGIDAEVTLDIELALALAPSSQIYVYEGPNSDTGVLNTYNQIATDNKAKQVSTSWGLSENFSSRQFLQAENSIFQQMAAQGQTIYAAAGDSGAFDNYPQNSSRALAVDDPASQPYIAGVGGTSLRVNSTTGAYASETVWNNGVGNGAGGGGVSSIWPIPLWQRNVPTVYSTTYRNVPDIALNADTNTGYSIYFDGEWTIFGGTSCAAPLWASFTALVNQRLTSDRKPVLGFVNPTIYGIGTSPSFSTDFYDILSGNNLFYNARGGYDNATGWGSFNGSNLFAALTNSSIVPPNNPPTQSSLLNVTLNSVGVFRRGGKGVYEITVNNIGDVPTSGPVSVAITLPAGLSYRSSSASGWVFNKSKLTFTQNRQLNPGSSYPKITLKVNVSANSPKSVTTQVTASGGNSAPSSASIVTSIN